MEEESGFSFFNVTGPGPLPAVPRNDSFMFLPWWFIQTWFGRGVDGYWDLDPPQQVGAKGPQSQGQRISSSWWGGWVGGWGGGGVGCWSSACCLGLHRSGFGARPCLHLLSSHPTPLYLPCPRLCLLQVMIHMLFMGAGDAPPSHKKEYALKAHRAFHYEVAEVGGLQRGGWGWAEVPMERCLPFWVDWLARAVETGAGLTPPLSTTACLQTIEDGGKLIPAATKPGELPKVLALAPGLRLAAKTEKEYRAEVQKLLHLATRLGRVLLVPEPHCDSPWVRAGARRRGLGAAAASASA